MEIAAGIVLYNPNLCRLKENIESIYKQVELLILIDNESLEINKIEKEYKNYNKIILIKNNKNLGIATALNQIMFFSKSKGYKWVLTLDQDSVCPTNMIEEYIKYVYIEKVAIISPLIIDRNNKRIPKVINSRDYENIEKCITSGSLINAVIWDKVGRFDDIMFIDEVDFEFCERVINNNYYIIRVNKISMLHEIGNITNRKFLIWDVTVKNHNAFRKYYIAKNVIYVAKKSNSYQRIIIAYLKVIKIMIVTFLYESNKKEKIKSILKGIKDS